MLLLLPSRTHVWLGTINHHYRHVHTCYWILLLTTTVIYTYVIEYYHWPLPSCKHTLLNVTITDHCRHVHMLLNTATDHYRNVHMLLNITSDHYRHVHITTTDHYRRIHFFLILNTARLLLTTTVMYTRVPEYCYWLLPLCAAIHNPSIDFRPGGLPRTYLYRRWLRDAIAPQTAVFRPVHDRKGSWDWPSIASHQLQHATTAAATMLTKKWRAYLLLLLPQYYNCYWTRPFEVAPTKLLASVGRVLFHQLWPYDDCHDTRTFCS